MNELVEWKQQQASAYDNYSYLLLFVIIWRN